MSKIIIAVVAIALLLGGILVTRNNNSDTAPVQTYADIQTSLESGAKPYDVRTPEEFAAGHFTEATNLPLQDIQQGTLPDAPKDQTIYVYCRSGNRSAEATTLLKEQGYTNVIDLGGLGHVRAMGGNFVGREM